MLVLKRTTKNEQSRTIELVMPEGTIKIKLVESANGWARIGIEDPDQLSQIYRSDCLRRKHE